MNKSLLSLKKTMLTLVLMAWGSALMAQLPCYLTATLKSSINGAVIPGVVLHAVSYGTGSSYAATTNQLGMANFQLPYYNTGISNVWAITALYQSDSVFLDTIAFPSAGYQTSKTFYLDSVVTPNCNPQLSVSQIPGTTLWRVEADTTNYRQCFGWGNGYFGLLVDGVQVDTHYVLPGGGIDGAQSFVTQLAPGTHNICVVVYAPQSVNFGQTCTSVTIGGPVQNKVMGFVRANGGLYQGDCLVELFGYQQNQLYYQADTLNWPLDSAFYEFSDVPGATAYYTRATPLSGDYVSTYFQSSLTWTDATPIFVPGLTMPPYELSDINLIQLYLPAGAPMGTVQGLISGLNNPVTNNLPGGGNSTVPFTSGNATVLVLDDQGRPVGYTSVNSDGTFFMEDFPAGNYSFVIDHPYVDAVARPLAFTSATPVVSVQATVTSAGVNVITGKKGLVSVAGISAYPNPVQNQLSIKNHEQIANLTLVNALGVSTKMEPSATLNLDNQTPGIYYLKGQTKAGEGFTLRFVKQ